MHQIVKCLNCGKIFESNVSYKRKYCSPECAYKSPLRMPKKRSKVKCLICGKELELPLSDVKHFKYCSRSCQGKSNKGKKKSVQWRQQTSNRMKKEYREGQRNMQGKNNSMFGRKRPEMSKWHEDPIFTKKRFRNMHLKPNKKENKLNILFKKHHFGFKYIGDGVALIGRYCPDFVHREKNKVIELFGDYWHSQEFFPKHETPQERIDYFKKRGYNCLVIWEHELRNENWIVEKVKAFMREKWLSLEEVR